MYLLAVVLVVAALVWLVRGRKDPLAKVPVIQGPWGLGELLRIKQLPLTMQEAARKYMHGLARIKFGPSEFVLISDPAAARKAFMQTSERDRPDIVRLAVPEALFFVSADRWRPMRRRINPSFATPYVNNMLPQMCNVGKDMVQELKTSAGTFINIGDLMHRATFDVLLRTNFSRTLQPSDNGILANLNILLESSVLVDAIYNIPVVGKHFHYSTRTKFEQARTSLRQFAAKELNERRVMAQSGASLPADLLTSLLENCAVEDDGSRASDSFFIDNILMFFGAGEDTTAQSLQWAIYLLCKHPEVMAGVVKELEDIVGDADELTVDHIANLHYLDKVCKEAMRLYPAAVATGRLLLEPLPVGPDVVLPAGTTVMINIIGMQRDPAHWERPDEFYPEHFDEDKVAAREHGVYCPFGGGARACIGIRLAQLEMRVLLVYLLKYFTLELQDGPEPQPAFELTTRPDRDILVRFSPRIA